MNSVDIKALGNGVNEDLATSGFKRFTGDDKSLTINITHAAPGEVNRLVAAFSTTDDDLRGGNDNINMTVSFKNGRSQVFNNVNGSNRWGNNSKTSVTLNLNQAVLPGNIASITISDTFGGGMGGDNWNMGSVQIRALGSGVNKLIASHGFKRFTGSDKTLNIPTTP
jgi:hypothetical protein